MTGPEILCPMVLDDEPEARTTFLPTRARPPTSTVSGDTRRPHPLTTSTPLEESRPCSPLYRPLMTESRYLATCAMSIPPNVERTPNLADSRTASAVSAACR